MNEINKKISAVFLATLMIASIFVVMVTPVAAAHEVTIDNIIPNSVRPGEIVNVIFTIIPSHAMEDVDIRIFNGTAIIGSNSTTYTNLTPNESKQFTVPIKICNEAEVGSFNIFVESTGIGEGTDRLTKSALLENRLTVIPEPILDTTPPHKIWNVTPADGTIMEFTRTNQLISVEVYDDVMTNDSITLHFIREGIDETPQNVIMFGTPGLSTTYTAYIDDTGVANNATVSFWISGTDDAGNPIPETLGGSRVHPIATYTVIERTLSFIYITPDEVDVILKQTVDFNFTAHDQFSNHFEEGELHTISWSVEDTAFGTIDANGLFNATGIGSTEIHVDVTYDGHIMRATGIVNIVARLDRVNLISPTMENPEYVSVRPGYNMANITFEIYTDNLDANDTISIDNTTELIEIIIEDGNPINTERHFEVLEDMRAGTFSTHSINVLIPRDVLSRIENGYLNVEVRAIDQDGSSRRTSDIANDVIKVDHTPPTTLDITRIDTTFPTRRNIFRVEGTVEVGATINVLSDATIRKLHVDSINGIWFAVVEIPSYFSEDEVAEFRVIATDRAGNEAYITRCFTFDRTPPDAVTDLNAMPKDDIGIGNILLNWTAEESNLTFRVYRFITRPTTDKDLIAIDISADKYYQGKYYFSYMDNCTSLLSGGVRYQYIVRAVDVAGNIGIRSNTVESVIGDRIPIGATISLSADDSAIVADGHHETTTIRATVRDKYGYLLKDARVNFSTTAGWVYPRYGITNADGVATTTLTADAVIANAVITGTVTITETIIYDTTTVAFTPDSYTIELGTGWNLISLPLIPVDNNILSVLGGIIDTVEIVWAYDAATDTWTHFIPGVGGPLELMEDGKGYWIRVNEPGFLDISGFGLLSGSAGLPSGTPPQLPPSYEVVAGWNLIGFTSTEPMTAGGSIYHPHGYGYGYLRGVAWTDMWTFCTGRWDWDRIEWVDNMEPGRGYWLFVTEDGIIAP